MSASPIPIPPAILPSDGRFGSGPSKVRPSHVEALVGAARDYLGTSHRQATVRFKVGEFRNGLAELFALPDGYEIVLGNGGTTAFWDCATFGLVDQHSQHLVFGEFSSKFASCVAAAPHLDDPEIISTDPGDHPDSAAKGGVDLYALTHNETSTGVVAPVERPRNGDGSPADGLVAVDATSAAGGVRVDLAECDVYYFAPQKCFGADGGIWVAACSPAALERIDRLSRSRWVPPFLNLATAVENSRKDQTYNTPALATIFLANEQVQWFLSGGGLEFPAGRCDANAAALYGWADAHELATPFVAEPSKRSPVVGTIDFADTIDAAALAATLRANGIVDVEPYRKLGRNQLRIGMFPAIDTADIVALTASIDYVLGRMQIG